MCKKRSTGYSCMPRYVFFFLPVLGGSASHVVSPIKCLKWKILQGNPLLLPSCVYEDRAQISSHLEIFLQTHWGYEMDGCRLSRIASPPAHFPPSGTFLAGVLWGCSNSWAMSLPTKEIAYILGFIAFPLELERCV